LGFGGKKALTRLGLIVETTNVFFQRQTWSYRLWRAQRQCSWMISTTGNCNMAARIGRL